LRVENLECRIRKQSVKRRDMKDQTAKSRTAKSIQKQELVFAGCELGRDLGPLLVRMAPVAYEFFSNIGT
jgi:hypothetical protein